MNTSTKETAYAHITSTPGISGGAPLIEGTRITVRCLAGYYQMGMTVDEILQSLPHLTAAQVHAGLAYYFDHQEEIDCDLAENQDIDFWKKQAVPHPKASVAQG